MRVIQSILLIAGYALLLHFSTFAFQGEQQNFDWKEIEASYSIKKFTVQDGLPINSVTYVHHHSDGFLYLATYDGLVRFDGIRFTTFNTFNTPEIKSNRITWLGGGEGDYLWFIDTESRLYGYNNGETEQIDLRGKKALKVEQTLSGKMLVLSDDGFFIQSEGLEFVPYDGLPSQQQIINSFLIDGTDIWVFYDDGLYLWSDGIFRKLINSDELLVPAISIINLTKSESGDLWALTDNSELLRISNLEDQKLYSYDKPGYQFWDFVEKKNQLIVSTRIGYVLLDTISGEFLDYNLSNDEQNYFENPAWKEFNDGIITKLGNSIYFNSKSVLTTSASINFIGIDSEESIWIATNGDGVYQIKKNNMISVDVDEVEGLRNVYGIWEGYEGVWTTSFNIGLHLIKNDAYQYWTQSNSGLTEIFFRTVFENKRGEVWAGNSDLWKFDNQNWVKVDDTTFNNRIDAIFEDSKDRFWVGTKSGLFEKEGDSFARYKDNFGNSVESVVAIKNKENGDLVVATLGQGLAMLNANDSLSFLTTSDGLNSNLIRDFHYQTHDTLWVITEDKGLNRVVFKGEELSSVHSITIYDGLVDNSLHRLIEDDFGYFWINSNKGIMRIRKQNLNHYVDGKSNKLWVNKFLEEDGLWNIEGNGGASNAGMLTSDGKLLFSNQAGLIYTRPEWHLSKRYNQLVNPIFEEINYSDSTLNVLSYKNIKLSKGDRSIQIKFTLPYLSYPQKLNLEYLIEGVNDSWQLVGDERTAVFTNLPAGNHRLKVRGSFDGELGFRENSLSITVPPFFYETAWFYLFSFIGLIAVFMGGVQFLLAQSKNREKKLNELVNVRTKELKSEKEKTEQALNEIQRLSAAKSQFFTNFTHELRTPLSLILNPLDEMLGETRNITQSKRGSLELMHRNVVRLKDLVNKLLDISKLNSDELTFSYQQIELVSAARIILAQFSQELKRKDIKCTLDTDLSNPVLLIDENALEHILVNLMSNAIKFTQPDGSIAVSINQVDNNVVISVKDSGVGIPENEIDRIFDPYFQGNSSVSKAGGTGIGLSLVKGLVERMGGIITVTSAVGIGSKFTLKFSPNEEQLPQSNSIDDSSNAKLELSEPEALLQPKEVASAIKVNSEVIKPRVLLVEDNADFRDYFAEVIASTYIVETAENGKQGLEKLSTFNPELIVSDIMMPEMDGYEMMRNIRAEERFKNIPFIFLSAKDSAEEIEKGLNLGADIFLSKPIENNILLTQIKVLLRRERLLKESTALVVQKEESPLVKEVKEIIHRHLGNPDLCVELIAESLATSSASLYRNWKKVSDVSINKTIAKIRFDEALKLIKEEKLNISEASYVVGFRQLSYFSRAFKKEYGVSPQEYLKDH